MADNKWSLQVFARFFFEGKFCKLKLFNKANEIAEISTIDKAISGNRPTPKSYIEEIIKLYEKVNEGHQLEIVGIPPNIYNTDKLIKAFYYVMGLDSDIDITSRDKMFCKLLLEAANESCQSQKDFKNKDKLTEEDYNKILNDIENIPIPKKFTWGAETSLDETTKEAEYAHDAAVYSVETISNTTTEQTVSESENPIEKLRNLAEKHFNTIKRAGRFGQYFPTKEEGKFISDITVTLKTSDQEALSFEHVIFPPEMLPEGCRFSISLSGKGGIGKSFLFLHLIDTIFANGSGRYSNVIPLYIELQKVNNDYNCDIYQGLFNELKRIDHDLTAESFSEYMKAAGRNVIVLADGMNEVVGIENRSSIANSIANTAADYNCRFCISSRENHVGMFNNLASLNGNFRATEVNKLTPEQIKDYLLKHTSDVQYCELHDGTRKLLETPQGLEMYVSLVNSDSSQAKHFTSLGELILAYSDSILGISNYRGDPHYDFSFEETLEEIAYNWVSNSVFEGKLTCDQHDKVQSMRYNRNINLEAIFPCTCGSHYDTEASFTFSHQNFRDCYCARFIARKIKHLNAENIRSTFSNYFNPSTSTVTNNDDILNLVSSFTSNGANEYDKKAIDTLREASKDEKDPLQNYDYPLNVLIRIFALRNENCIAELDFTDLDLREISLNGYFLFNKETGKSTVFRNTRINVNTFLKNGLDMAAKTITTFRYNGKEYIVAFASNSALIIDIAESQARVVRNLPMYGKVNCCCATTKNGLPVIYIGEGIGVNYYPTNVIDGVGYDLKRGTLSEFYPNILFMNENEDEAFVQQKYIKQILTLEDASIESICIAKLDSEEFIFYTTCDGILHMRKKYMVGHNTNSSLRLDMSGYSFISQSNCRLTSSKKNNLIFVSWGRNLYFIDCSLPIKNNTSKESYISKRNLMSFPNVSPVCYVKSNDTEVIDHDIEDIFACDSFLFVNLVYKIAVFKILDTNGKIVFRDYIYPAGKANNSIKFTRFSEYPDPDVSASVLVGVNVDSYHSSNSVSDHQIKRFYQLCYSECVELPDRLTKGLGNDYDGFATWTGVPYILGNKTYLASVSSKRTVEIDCISDEEIPKRIYAGAYNGVHYIDSSQKERIICGNYDGNVVCLKSSMQYKSGHEHEVWKVENVFRLHENWVWKCVFLSETQILSCGYDGKLWLTETLSGKRTCLLNKEGEQFLDFCIDSSDNIWSISHNKLFFVQKTGENWATMAIEEFNNLKADKKYFRTIAIDQVSTDNAEKDDLPILFYNEGQGSQGHIAKLYNRRDGFGLVDLIDMTQPSFKYETIVSGKIKTTYAYIRHMRFHCFNGKKRLIGVGNIGEEGLFFISKYSGENEEITGRMSVEGIHISGFGEINDFTVTESKNGYVLWLAHKDFTISVYSIHENPNGLYISRFYQNNVELDASEDTISLTMPDQPMCLKAYGYDVLIGLLNGTVIKASISTSQYDDTDYADINAKYIARTYADLMANNTVKLRNCEFDEKEEFATMFRNYFNLEQD